MNSRLFSVDLETTGLDERRQEAWEVGIVIPASPGEPERDTDVEILYQFPIRRWAEAEPEALAVGQFHERYVSPPAGWAYDPAFKMHVKAIEAARAIADLTAGLHPLGAAVQFDLRFLAELLRAWGQNPQWHHRVLDLGSFAAGVVGADGPIPTRTLSETLVENTAAHTALGDARWNLEVYERLLAIQDKQR